MEIQELKTLSLDFRRLSSNLLNATDDNADILLARFKKFLDNTPFISSLLAKEISNIEYDYNECFISDEFGYHCEVKPPVNESCHIKAMYDYLTMIVESNGNVTTIALQYPHSSRKFNEIIQHFFKISFKALIDFINDSISKEIMLLQDKAQSSMIQNIGAVYGTAVQGTGKISSYNITHNNDIEEIQSLISKILSSIDTIHAPIEDIDNVKDDLEVISEQTENPSPKKKRIQKALNGIKSFVTKFVIPATVGIATNIDWLTLMDRLQVWSTSLQ
ncbi:hypothetical protein [Christensenella minuta]|uniref:hypothetical protein n=1 Tax=Christensenella minuta TaxID=626937 RepID=UPI0021586A83|nr:hypothetical protein [Christensenella minuta]